MKKKYKQKRIGIIHAIDKGKKRVSEESREKMRSKRLGKKHDPLVRRKISQTMKKYIKTEEHRDRIAIALYGKKHSPETLKKISDTMKKRAAEREPMSRMTKFKIASSLREYHQWKKRAIAKRKTETAAERIARWEGKYKYEDPK